MKPTKIICTYDHKGSCEEVSNHIQVIKKSFGSLNYIFVPYSLEMIQALEKEGMDFFCITNTNESHGIKTYRVQGENDSEIADILSEISKIDEQVKETLESDILTVSRYFLADEDCELSEDMVDFNLEAHNNYRGSGYTLEEILDLAEELEEYYDEFHMDAFCSFRSNRLKTYLDNKYALYSTYLNSTASELEHCFKLVGEKFNINLFS